MTLIFALLAKAWPAIVVGLTALGSAAWIFINKKKTDTIVAQEQQKTAAAKADASAAVATAAATNDVSAQADKDATQAALTSLKESQNVDKEYAALPDGAAMQRLRDAGFVANDDGTAATGPAPAAASGGPNENH